MLPEDGADEMEIGGDIYNFNFPVNGIALSPDKMQLLIPYMVAFL